MSFGQFLWESLVEAYHEAAELLIVNALWVLFTLLILTAPPAAAGMYYATNQIAHQRAVSWRTFFEGFRKYWWVSWLWAILNVVALAIMVFNANFYGSFENQWLLCARGLFLGLIIPWLLLQVYIFPLLVEQEEPSLLTAIRNSAVLYLRMPGISLGTVIVLLASGWLSYLLRGFPFFVFVGSLSAFLANRAVMMMVKKINLEAQNQQTEG
jgi:uncharacterized membrane protein YesL